MAERLLSPVKATVGFASETGPRERNEDFGGAVFGYELPKPRRDIVAAVADGIGGARGGRVAAETAVRGFLDGFCDLPETMEVRRAAAAVLNSLNNWIYALAKRDSKLAGMGCTFTALILRGRIAHIVHVGDSRAYRLRGNRLALLTTDHLREATGGSRSNILNRALGVEAELRLDYAAQPVALHDRFLLCSDGVHACLTAEHIADILRQRSASEDTARALVTAALQAGSTDNCTALVADVVDLPTGETADVGADIMQLPLIPTPIDGQTVDGFVLKVLMSDGRYTRLFGAFDEVEGGEVALKFPKPQVAAVVHLSRRLRARSLGRRADQQSLCRPHHRTAAGAANQSLHRDAALSGRAVVDAARAAAAGRARRGAQHRASSSRAASARCIAPASFIATSSRTISFSKPRARSS